MAWLRYTYERKTRSSAAAGTARREIRRRNYETTDFGDGDNYVILTLDDFKELFELFEKEFDE